MHRMLRQTAATAADRVSRGGTDGASHDMNTPWSAGIPQLRPRRGFVSALVTLVVAASLCGCGSRGSTAIGGGWEIVTETSGIPEAGGHHPFLHRHSETVNVRVDTDVYS